MLITSPLPGKYSRTLKQVLRVEAERFARGCPDKMDSHISRV